MYLLVLVCFRASVTTARVYGGRAGDLAAFSRPESSPCRAREMRDLYVALATVTWIRFQTFGQTERRGADLEWFQIWAVPFGIC